MNLRVGSGYDIHQLRPGNILKLGGVSIPSSLASIGHSDGDVLLHAIIDALLGAAGLGDIGSHFPSSDDKYAGIDSRILLEQTLELVKKKNFQIGNLDCTVILQQTRLENHKREMQETIAKILKVDLTNVSVKAKTADQLNATGNNLAIEAHAVVLLVKN